MAVKMKGMGSVTAETKDGMQLVKESEDVESPSTGEDELYAKVTWGFGGTIPTVQYGNVRMYAEIELPSKLTEIDDVFDFAVNWVDQKLTAKHAEVQKLYGLS